MRTLAILAALLLVTAAFRGSATPDAKQVKQLVQQIAQATPAAQPGAISAPAPVSVRATAPPLSTRQPAAVGTVALSPTPTPLPTAMLTKPPAVTRIPSGTRAQVPSATPRQRPSVVTDKAINLRAGPGTTHPVVGTIQVGQTYAVQSKLAGGPWLEICCVDQHSAWVSASLVTTAGDMARVPIAETVPTPPAAPTPAPTRPSATTAPARMPYEVKSVRLRGVHEGLQTCTAGYHAIIATVVDAAGKPIDGVPVHEVWTNTTHVTGERVPGTVEWATWKNGGGKLQIVDDGGQPLSPLTREMSNAWPDVDLMLAAGYCACESFDEAACAAALQSHSRYFTYGHYVYEVVFQRTGSAR